MGEPHIELDLGGRETDAKTARLKSWSNIIATAGAIVIALLAFFKPQDQAPTKAAYSELRTAVEENSKQLAQNHDDVVALRSYLSGYLHDSVLLPSASVSAAVAAAPVPSVSASGGSSRPPVRTQEPHGSKLASGGMHAYVVRTDTLAEPPPPLPSLHPRPSLQRLPDFDKVMKASQ